LSFVLLRGRCRYCKKPIAFIYPLIELVCAGLALIVVAKFGLRISSIFLFISLSLLALASFIDVEDREVDLRILIVGIVLAVIWQAFSIVSWPGAAFILLAGLAAMLVPLAFYLISRERWMGLGDVLFSFWIGVIAGYPAALVAMLVAFLLGGIFGIIILVVHGKKAERRIAFGPFIAIGGLIGLLWGQTIIDFYLKLIGF
jgi:leader peptidase (prepilin peptidase)/N-methyltransferase